MKKLLSIVLLSAIYFTFAAYAIEYPQLKSAVSTTGITANFDSIYSKADQLNMIHDVLEHDSSHIILKYKDTGNWVIMKDDGTMIIASTSAFSLDIKKVLESDLVRAKDLIQSAGGKSSEAPFVYYTDNPYLYRAITYDFKNDFDLMLAVPNGTIQKAMLTVTGPDFASYDTGTERILQHGQHYSIDDKEVSGCDAVPCLSGISCVAGPCASDATYAKQTTVSVNPVDITKAIASGVHKISASGIDNQHTLIIEAVTSLSSDKMLLYSNDYKTMIYETRSLPMTELYALIQPNATKINTTTRTMNTTT